MEAAARTEDSGPPGMRPGKLDDRLHAFTAGAAEA